MSNALVVRTQRHKKIGDAASPMVFTLKRKSKDAKIFDLERIAQDIEALGGMSAEDVVHVGKAIVRQMRQVILDRPPVDGRFGHLLVGQAVDGLEQLRARFTVMP